MREADEIYVLDTGSDDGTAEALTALGAVVKTEIIKPWRFDVARNRSLTLVPDDADICVCTDLDEVFRAGWREALERAWKPGTDRATYEYAWSITEDGRPGTVFIYEKIHARHGYRWTHPVHEVLELTGETAESKVYVEGMQLDHRADDTKSRAQYLPLLEMSVLEDPEDDRNLHYLGREYYFHGRWEDAIITLKRHLLLSSATWADERCASMRYISRCLVMLRRRDEARAWLLRAAAEAPHLREPWLELARLLYEDGCWDGVVYFAREALKIKERPRSYVCEADSWGSQPWDLLSLGLYYTGRYSEAAAAAAEAARLAPASERIAKNLALMRERAGEG